MGKIEIEKEIDQLAEQWRAEAVKNAVSAFNDGYMLGRKHAEMVFGGKDEQD